MKYKELEKILEKAKKMKEEGKIEYFPSVLIEGRAGIGKSSVIKEFAKKNGFSIVDVRLINYDIGDFLLKVPETNKKKLSNMYNEWLITLATTRTPTILLLDEIDKANPQIQRLAYQLILDREVEGLKLSNEVMIIAIQNTTEDGQFFSIENEKPLYDRFFFRVRLDFDEEEWLRWGLDNLDERIVTFLTKNKDFIYIESEEKLIATPRRWEFLSKVIEGVSDLGELETLTTAVIDKERAVAFREFLEIVLKYRNLDELIKKEKLKEIDSNDFYALAPAIAEIMKGIVKEDIEKSERIFRYLKKEIGGEFVLLILKFMLRKDKEDELIDKLLEIKVVQDILDILLED